MTVETRLLDREPHVGLARAAEAGFLTDYGRWIVKCDGREYHALVSRDNIGTTDEPDWRWHVSVSGENDVPPWRDLVAAGHALRPGVTFVVGVPPRSQWMNVHPHVLHLFELRDPALEEQWRFEAQGHVPS